MYVQEFELVRTRYRRYLATSVILIFIALLLTYVGIKSKVIWLLIIAFATLFASFALLFAGLILRAEKKVMEELRRKSR